MTFDPAALRDFAAAYTAAWCSQKRPASPNFISPGGGLSVNGGSPAVGREAITETVQGFMTAFPDLRVLLDGVSQQGDDVVYSWTLTGTNTAPGGLDTRVRVQVLRHGASDDV